MKDHFLLVNLSHPQILESSTLEAFGSWIRHYRYKPPDGPKTPNRRQWLAQHIQYQLSQYGSFAQKPNFLSDIFDFSVLKVSHKDWFQKYDIQDFGHWRSGVYWQPLV
jgi:hypothetical protein